MGRRRGHLLQRARLPRSARAERVLRQALAGDCRGQPSSARAHRGRRRSPSRVTPGRASPTEAPARLLARAHPRPHPPRVRPARATAARPPRLPRAGVRRVQLHLLQGGHLADRIEGWAAGGARLGIEYRYPLLDRRVIEFALGLSPEQFLRGRWSRWLMRRAFDRLLPPQVCWNSSKSDPVREESLREAFIGAVPVVRRILEDRYAPGLRSRYVDMPRLMQSLDPDRIRAAWPRRARPLYSALRLLDF